MNTCKNCGHTFEGNFCNECGQKAKTDRLNWKYLADEAKYTFLHFNGGATYTIKKLVTGPGDMINEFIDGKRVKHYKPILLLFVLAGIYGLLMHYLDMSGLFRTLNPNDDKTVEFQIRTFDFVSGHYSLFEVLLVPVFAFASWLAFRKFGYNYIENVIINCYVASLRLVFNIATFPIMYWSVKAGTIFQTQLPLGLIGFALTVWAYLQLYKTKNTANVLVRLMVMFAIAGILIFFIMISAVLVVNAIWPEMIPKPQPQ